MLCMRLPLRRFLIYIYIYIYIKCQRAPWREVRQEYVYHLPMTPVWVGLRVLEVRHLAVFY